MATKKAGQEVRRTFADLVRELPIRTTGQGRIIPTVMHRKHWTDESGVTWRRRGTDYLEGKPLLRMLQDAEVIVMHEYLGRLVTIPVSERQAFWDRATQSMMASSYSDFYGVEFTNEERQHLLVIHEDC